MNVSFALAEVEGVPQVTVAGDIDLASAPRFDEMLEIAGAKASGTLVVSLQRCDYCDSTGLSVLLAHARRIENLCVVVPPESHLRKIVRLAGLEDALGVADSMADAMRRVRSLVPA